MGGKFEGPMSYTCGLLKGDYEVNYTCLYITHKDTVLFLITDHFAFRGKYQGIVFLIHAP